MSVKYGIKKFWVFVYFAHAFITYKPYSWKVIINVNNFLAFFGLVSNFPEFQNQNWI